MGKKKEAVDKALDALVTMVESGSTEGYKLEAAREILKYQAMSNDK